MICIAGGLSALGDPALIEVDAARGLVPSPPTRSPFRRSSWTRRR
jgi:hypothetical protein